MSIAILIFSKDRGAQLELLLRSHREQAREWDDFAVSVLYTTSAPEFDRGYDVVKEKFPTVAFQVEDHGRPINRQVLDLARRDEREFFHFLADELVFLRPFSTTDREFDTFRGNRDIAALSLRMSPHINYSQPLGLSTPPPVLKDRIWSWKPKPRLLESLLRVTLGRYPARGDWRLQMNVDANVFRYGEFLRHFETLPDIASVNVFETIMLQHPMPAPYLLCYPDSKLINLAMNRVDDVSRLPYGGHTAAEFNQRFLSGEILSYESLKTLHHNACHIVVEPEWVPDPVQDRRP